MTKLYASEAEMCAQFITYAEAVGWTAYAETAGWDILLVRRDGGDQIGVQAKLALNADVLNQTLESEWDCMYGRPGPDFRCVLVPRDKSGKLGNVCRHLGITVVTAQPGTPSRRNPNWIKVDGRHGRHEANAFSPGLPFIEPHRIDDDRWYDRCPVEREQLPEYVPDVAAGVSGPRQLSHWKIKAIKLAVILEVRGYVTKADFAHLKLSSAMWLTNAWLTYHADTRGAFIAHGMPDFKKQHPRNYAEIAADFDKWKPEAPALQVGSEAA